MQSTKQKGNIAEQKAVDFLKSNSFKIVEQNFYAKKLGEIDIIAFKNNTYHFIEVKSGESFESIYNITPAKLRKLINSIEYYIKIKNIPNDYCIDAIIVSDNTCDYIENITL